MKSLIQGDVHGNTTAVRRALHLAQKFHCDEVGIAGDVGIFWPTEPFDHFLGKMSRAAAAYELPLWFLDGNHENYDELEERGAFSIDPSASLPTLLAPGVTYMPRGTVIEREGLWEGDIKRCLIIGGAYSVDKPYRLEGRSWWPQEEITQYDLDQCFKAGKVDVVISHDAPDEAFRAALMIAADGNVREMNHLVMKNDQRFPGARPNRMALQQVLESAQPKLWIHGHYHARYEADIQDGKTHVVGLDLETEDFSFFVVDWADW